jgi:hypothetical protein
MWTKNLLQKQSTSYSLIYITVSLITFGFAIAATKPGQAEIPDAANITRVEGRTISGRELTIRDEGNSRSITKVIPGSTTLRRFRDVLGVPAGDRKATLDFFFFRANRKLKSAGYRAQTVPQPNAAEYRLPCRVNGGKIALSWRRSGEGRDRGCQGGVRVSPNLGLSSLGFPDSDEVSVSSKQKQLFGSPNSIFYCGARPKYSGFFKFLQG